MASLALHEKGKWKYISYCTLILTFTTEEHHFNSCYGGKEKALDGLILSVSYDS